MKCISLVAFVIFYFSTSCIAQSNSLNQDSIPDQFLYEVPILESFASKQDPIAQYNFSKSTISKNSIGKDMPHLISKSPSAVFTSDDGLGIGYSGIRIRGSDASRTNISINGVPLNDAESGQVYWVDLPDLIESAEDIQVQRGIGNSTYGQSSFGANINIKTFSRKDTASGEAKMTMGSFNTRKFHAKASTGTIGKNTRLEIGASQISSDGYIDRASTNLKSYFANLNIATKTGQIYVLFRSGDEKTYQAWNGLPIQYKDSTRTYNPSGYIQKSNSFYPNENDNYGQKHLNLIYHGKVKEGITSRITLYGTHGKGYYEQYKNQEFFKKYGLDSINQNGGLVNYSDFIVRKWLDNTLLGAMFNLEFEKVFGGIFSTSFHINKYNGKHFGEVLWGDPYAIGFTPHRYYEDNGIKNEKSLSMKFRKAVGSFSFFGDLQYRTVSYEVNPSTEGHFFLSKRIFHFLNPKIGASFYLSPHHSLTVFTGINHKEPLRDDFEGEALGKPIKPERLWDIECIYKWKNQYANLELTAFRMQYKDQLVLDGRINEVGAFQRINLPKSYRSGLEALLQLPLGNIFLEHSTSFSVNKIKRALLYFDDWDFASQYSKEYTNTDIAFSPTWVIKNQINYDVPSKIIGSLSLSVFHNFVSRQFIDNTSSIKRSLQAYQTFDFSARWQPKNLKHFSIDFTLYNFGSANYFTNAWTYPFKSHSYNPIADNPNASEDLEPGTYQLIGLFPQAPIHFLLGIHFKI